VKTGSVDLPVIVDNEYIKKTEILPQPEGDPPLAMAAAVKMIEIYMVLEQVRCARTPMNLTLSHAPGAVCDQCPVKNARRRFFSK
jgi:hypothetical protein